MLVNEKKLPINENEIDSFLKRNIIFIDKSSNKAKLCSDREAEEGAQRFIRILNAPECREFFLKVMYHLPYETRERILESSTKPWIRTPKKYFTYSAKRELDLLGF